MWRTFAGAVSQIVVLEDQPPPTGSGNSVHVSIQRAMPASISPYAPPRVSQALLPDRVPWLSSISAWLCKSQMLLRRSSGSGLLITTNCEGWNDRRMPEPPCFRPEVLELRPALLHLCMELRHVRMCGIRRQIRRHSVHADLLPAEIAEYIVKVSERNPQVRSRLPAPGVVAL